ncbi:MAG: S1 RNA-binding domain-containing protein [Thermoanaerobaculaceae bacterium]|nr:S1 RNA-binding domain-containing protein [Thermoanaerobaculaceae bacterium]MDI9621268.1 S1 RNA-binding domain-containing protein [Acidobacteriota bacterium]NLH11911.1 S1 RNA-binding domain-containing protein [Holophagae bacterium]HPW54200.1 S1 RNA-binding domain-containing protein [Thermoanaerobaculaceae bacterium]
MTEDTNPTTEQQSFAEALAASFQNDELEIGQLITGTIMAVHGDVVLIAVGGKSEAVMDRTEVGELRPGDGLDAIVIALSPEIRVSHKLVIERREREALRGAAANAIPVEGKVTGRNKGGYDVSIAGIRAFCPMSQIELGFPRNVDSYLGKVFRFRIIEVSDDLQTMVVSRAAVLKEEREHAADAAWARLVPGAEIEGTVKSIRDFGVFVDLGGVDGMVHISELSHRIGVRPTQVVKIGDTVKVKVIEADREKNRIALSMKALEPDPWAEVAARFPSGATFEGTVARKTEFGLFVELMPGVDGLIHVSQLPPGMKLDDPALAAGAPVRGWVRECDLDRRRLSLTLREMATSDPWVDAAERYAVEAMVEGTVERTANFGVFVQLEPGVTALIPASETDLSRGADLGSSFTPGSRVSATVLSVDPARKRISLSVKKAKEGKAVKEFRKWAEERKVERKPEVTAFGAALMRALQEPKQ